MAKKLFPQKVQKVDKELEKALKKIEEKKLGSSSNKKEVFDYLNGVNREPIEKKVFMKEVNKAVNSAISGDTRPLVEILWKIIVVIEKLEMASRTDSYRLNSKRRMLKRGNPFNVLAR